MIAPHNIRQYRMGNTFLRSYYTIYDSARRQIGIVGPGVVVPKTQSKIIVTPVTRVTERPILLQARNLNREVKWIIPVGIGGMICLIVIACCCVKSCCVQGCCKKQRSRKKATTIPEIVKEVNPQYEEGQEEPTNINVNEGLLPEIRDKKIDSFVDTLPEFFD